MGLEGDFVSARHPDLDATVTTPIGEGMTPFGVETGIPCSLSDESACDPAQGLLCSTRILGGSSGQCIAYPVVQKDQNLILPQEKVISRCLEAGMVLHYGLVFDPYERPIREFQDELEMIVSNHRITLPSFLTLAIPLLGTPMFQQRLNDGALLPNLRLREMDGRTLIYRTRDPFEQVVEYVGRMETSPIEKRKLFAYAGKFFRHYRKTLSPWAMISGLLNVISTGMPSLGTNAREKKVPREERRRTFNASTEPLGSLYQPVISVPSRYQDHFQPLLVTDEQGRLHQDLHADLGWMEKPQPEPSLCCESD